MTPLLSSALLRTQPDERLVALAAAGHDRAFEAIVDRYRRPLQRHVRRYLPDGRAEDVVQATFVSAWSSLSEGTKVRDLRPWLYRIATNGALNVLKRAGADDRPLTEIMDARGAGDPESELERRDAARRTLHGLADLPERQRTALVATAVAGRSHREVAEELGMTDGALRQLVHRARTQLRAAAAALTPTPLLTALASSHELTTARVAEIAGGAGGAGIAAAGVKLGAVAISTGAIVAGAPQVAKLTHEGAARRATATVKAPSDDRGASSSRAIAATPGAVATPIAVISAGTGEARRKAVVKHHGKGAGSTHANAGHRAGSTGRGRPVAGGRGGSGSHTSGGSELARRHSGSAGQEPGHDGGHSGSGDGGGDDHRSDATSGRSGRGDGSRDQRSADAPEKPGVKTDAGDQRDAPEQDHHTADSADGADPGTQPSDAPALPRATPVETSDAAVAASAAAPSDSSSGSGAGPGGGSLPLTP